MVIVEHIAVCRPAAPKRPSLQTMFTVARQRRALAKLSDAALDDLGLSRCEAVEEASRPVWDVPQNWRR
ncbi:MAG: DUF1127 domain-containing protein [Planktomarina sp.]